MSDVSKLIKSNDSLQLNNEAAAAQASRSALSEQAFQMPGASMSLASGSHELRNLGIATGSGFLIGGGLTAGAEVATIKLLEPVAKPMMAMAFAFLGGGRAATSVMQSSLTIGECLTPKPILIGGLIGAGILAGGYEFYKHAWK